MNINGRLPELMKLRLDWMKSHQSRPQIVRMGKAVRRGMKFIFKQMEKYGPAEQAIPTRLLGMEVIHHLAPNHLSIE